MQSWDERELERERTTKRGILRGKRDTDRSRSFDENGNELRGEKLLEINLLLLLLFFFTATLARFDRENNRESVERATQLRERL